MLTKPATTSFVVTLSILATSLVAPPPHARRQQAQSDPDAATVRQLVDAGSDLRKPHDPIFYIYLPTESAARAVADTLERMGLKTEVRRAAIGPDWLCKATKHMMLTVAALGKLRQTFIGLVSPLHGDYDGWEAKVVK